MEQHAEVTLTGPTTTAQPTGASTRESQVPTLPERPLLVQIKPGTSAGPAGPVDMGGGTPPPGAAHGAWPWNHPDPGGPPRIAGMIYDHTEYEGTEVGTFFLIEGYDARVELRHEKLGPFEGALGYQANHSDFSALGAEAFLPAVENESHAAFLFEEVVQGDLRWQMGLRFDHSEVRPGPLVEGAL